MALVESAVIKRSVMVGRRKTSISLEDEFWDALRAIAQSRQTHLSALIAVIESGRGKNSLSSAIRVYVLNHYRTR